MHLLFFSLRPLLSFERTFLGRRRKFVLRFLFFSFLPCAKRLKQQQQSFLVSCPFSPSSFPLRPAFLPGRSPFSAGDSGWRLPVLAVSFGAFWPPYLVPVEWLPGDFSREEDDDEKDGPLPNAVRNAVEVSRVERLEKRRIVKGGISLTSSKPAEDQ